LVRDCVGKSKRETERILVSLAPEAPCPDRVRPVSADRSELKITVDEALLGKLKRVRELTAHKNPNPSYNELLHQMADLVLRKLDPLEKSPSPAKVKSAVRIKPIIVKWPALRTVPAGLKRQIWRRDQGRCQFVDRKPGKR